MPFLVKRHKSYCCTHWIRAGYTECNRRPRGLLQAISGKWPKLYGSGGRTQAFVPVLQSGPSAAPPVGHWGGRHHVSHQAESGYSMYHTQVSNRRPRGRLQLATGVANIQGAEHVTRYPIDSSLDQRQARPARKPVWPSSLQGHGAILCQNGSFRGSGPFYVQQVYSVGGPMNTRYVRRPEKRSCPAQSSSAHPGPMAQGITELSERTSPFFGASGVFRFLGRNRKTVPAPVGVRQVYAVGGPR